MDGEWIPAGITSMTPGYLNFTENLLTVQFIHRMIAYALIILIAILWWKAVKNNLHGLQKNSILLIVFAAGIQVLLGIFTVLYKVPLTLAILHQAGGFLLFSSVIAAMFFFSKTNQVTD
jgi:cytochrome c oxidase assembly protein subunit 15